MEFLPWKTINLDGSFRVTAPESVSEEILEELKNVISNGFSKERGKKKILIIKAEGVEFPIAQFNPSIAITRLVSFAEQSPSGYDTKVRMDEECRVK